ncbi:hypothetical protein QGX11_gp036 [Pseudomonas phage PPSC2]|uniref:Uncharacterized protein n=1 Tax=Pseudomonas phage PPSC2 TaxID=2041350 RepID=A0A2R2YB23_9CAUD|nr:hypothetical protein QGX11_gp036 [Pseudomonas phage PPSC2]ATN92799.1 hypothetical protein PPSC2_36 [Pseudomonas phage PPSC2]
MKFLICIGISAVLMFGSIFITQANHFDDQKMACIRAGGNGTMLKSSMGIPVGYKCQRMHLVMKYRNGGYK